MDLLGALTTYLPSALGSKERPTSDSSRSLGRTWELSGAHEMSQCFLGMRQPGLWLCRSWAQGKPPNLPRAFLHVLPTAQPSSYPPGSSQEQREPLQAKLTMYKAPETAAFQRVFLQGP